MLAISRVGGPVGCREAGTAPGHRVSDPKMARAHFALGYTLGEQGRPVEAIAALKDCLVIDPGVVDAQYVLGTLYLAQGLPNEAILLFKAVRARGTRSRLRGRRSLPRAKVLRDVLARADGALARGGRRDPDDRASVFPAEESEDESPLLGAGDALFRADIGAPPDASGGACTTVVSRCRRSDAMPRPWLPRKLALEHQPGYLAASLARGRVLQKLDGPDQATAGFRAGAGGG